MVKRFQWWWGQPDHHAWFSSYLKLRRMSGVTRGVLALLTASMALIPFGMLWSSAPPDNTARVVMSVISVIGGGAYSLLWIL